jgi:hypothetical protein
MPASTIKPIIRNLIFMSGADSSSRNKRPSSHAGMTPTPPSFVWAGMLLILFHASGTCGSTPAAYDQVRALAEWRVQVSDPLEPELLQAVGLGLVREAPVEAWARWPWRSPFAKSSWMCVRNRSSWPRPLDHRRQPLGRTGGRLRDR